MREMPVKRGGLMNILDLGLQAIASVVVFVGFSALFILSIRGFAEGFLQWLEHQAPSRRAALAIVFYLLFVFVPLGASAFLAGALWRKRVGVWWGIGIGALCVFSVALLPGIASAIAPCGLATAAVWIIIWSGTGAFVRSRLHELKRDTPAG